MAFLLFAILGFLSYPTIMSFFDKNETFHSNSKTNKNETFHSNSKTNKNETFHSNSKTNKNEIKMYKTVDWGIKSGTDTHAIKFLKLLGGKTPMDSFDCTTMWDKFVYIDKDGLIKHSQHMSDENIDANFILGMSEIFEYCPIHLQEGDKIIIKSIKDGELWSGTGIFKSMMINPSSKYDLPLRENVKCVCVIDIIEEFSDENSPISLGLGVHEFDMRNYNINSFYKR